MKGNKLLQEGELAGASVQGQVGLRPQILVVDEDNDLRKLYAEVLTRSGYCVDAVEDGAVGWKALKASSYCLLITEHDLPVLTGVELVKMVRAARMALPVVMAAERLPTHALARDPSLQLAALLPKPFYISELLETVSTVLRATNSSNEKIIPQPNWLSQPSANGLKLSAP